MRNKNLIKYSTKLTTVVLAASMVASMVTACGKKADTAVATEGTWEAITENDTDVVSDHANMSNEELLAEEMANAVMSHSATDGKDETVYIIADANGNNKDVIDSVHLMNGNGADEIKDQTDLKEFENVNGYETYTTDADGNVTWKANGNDIYYQGNTDKQLPVDVKISYQLDGKEIAPEDLAGKSGKVTIRFDYTNNEKTTVEINGKEEEVNVPFAMMSGVVLPADHFQNIEVTNGRIVTEGRNSVVMGVAFPGLKESINMGQLKEKAISDEAKDKLDDMESDIPAYVEITADATDFELGMTMTTALSNLLSQINMTEDIDTTEIHDKMDELSDGATQLVDGSQQLADGTVELRDGSKKLLDGTADLKDGTSQLRDGANDLKDGTTELKDGTTKLANGTTDLQNGVVTLKDGSSKLANGTNSLKDGTGKLASGADTLKDGTQTLADKSGELKDGVKALDTGAQKVSAGASAVDVGANKLDVGIQQLKKGLETPVDISAVQKQLQTVVSSTKADDLKKAVGVLQTASTTLTKLSGLSALADSIQNVIGVLDSVSTNANAENITAIQTEISVAQKNLENAQAAYDNAKSKVDAIQSAISNAQSALAELQSVYDSALNNKEDFTTVVEGSTGKRNVPARKSKAVGSTDDSQKKDELEEATEVPEEEIENPEEDVEIESTEEEQEEAAEESEEEETEEPEEEEAEDFVEETENASDNAEQLEARASIFTGLENVFASAGRILTQGAVLQVQAAEGQGVPVADVEKIGEKITALESSISALDESLAGAQTELETAKTNLDGAQSALSKAQSDAQNAQLVEGTNQGRVTAVKEGLTTIKGMLSDIDVDGIQKLVNGVDAVAETLNTNAEAMEHADFSALSNFSTMVTALSNGVDQLSAGSKELTAGTSALKDGAAQVSGGTSKLSVGSDALVDGVNQLNDGAGSLKDGAHQLDDGAGDLQSGAYQLDDGVYRLLTGAVDLNNGAHDLDDGAGKLDNGVNDLVDGVVKLDDGATDLHDGQRQLYDGIVTLQDGAQELADGMFKLDDEGISKLTELFGDDVDDVVQRINAVIDAGKEYNSFAGSAAEEGDSRVKFIYKTDGIKVES